MGTIIFDNPSPEAPFSRSKCVAERLISWVKSDVPILRIEQNGKQVWTSLGSYQSIGDSCIATFMAPVTLEAGKVTLYLVNGHDNTVPYEFVCVKDIKLQLKGIVGGSIAPLGLFALIGEGFLPTPIIDKKNAIDELEHNVGYDKLSKEEQWTTLNRRIASDWGRQSEGNFLHIEQNGKKWDIFVEECGLSRDGMTMIFIAPPDIVAGPAKMRLTLRLDKKEVSQTDLDVTVR